MNYVKAIITGLIYAAAFGCGDFADQDFEDIELGTAEQALNTPSWYGWGQDPIGNGPLHARFQCSPSGTYQCYVPNTKLQIWHSLPATSDGDTATLPANGGLPGTWWVARYAAALAKVKSIAESKGFVFRPCTVVASAGFPFPDNGSVYCKQRQQQGGMWLRIRSRVNAGPNSTLDTFGFPVAQNWSQVTPRLRAMSQCDAIARPAAIVANSALWNGAGATGQGFPLGSGRAQLVENIIGRQIFHCLGLGTYQGQGPTPPDGNFPTPWAMETDAGTVAGVTYGPGSIRATANSMNGYWFVGYGLTAFEGDLLQQFAPF